MSRIKTPNPPPPTRPANIPIATLAIIAVPAHVRDGEFAVVASVPEPGFRIGILYPEVLQEQHGLRNHVGFEFGYPLEGKAVFLAFEAVAAGYVVG